MPVDPKEAERLKNLIFSRGSNYSFSDWIHTTAELQTIAFGRDPAEIPLGDEFKDFARWNFAATVVELSEFLDEVPWKPWASNLDLQRKAAIGEIVDALHFIANLLRLLQVDGTELTLAYQAKQIKNLQRQIDGYDGKKEKCGYCHRELDQVEDVLDRIERYKCTAPGCKAQGEFCSPDHHRMQQEKMNAH